MKQRIAFLGPSGTYSELAAHQIYGASAEYTPCDTLDDVMQTVEQGRATAAVLPVENSSGGSVHRTLELLAEMPLTMCGEVLLPIHHQLLSRAVTLADITEVAAHPQALLQCRRWLDAHVPKAVRLPAASNAEAARSVHDSAHNNRAAIAGVQAAEIYKLPILVPNIEDDAHNTTRFIAVSNTTPAPTGHDKTSLVCSLPHKAGSLYGLLGIFAKHNINLLKLESQPQPQAAWDYLFYIDCEGHAAADPMQTALQQVQAYALQYKLLGSYPRAQSEDIP